MIRIPPRRAALVAVYMGLMLALSSVPGRELARLGIPVSWLNLGHVPLFAGLAWVTLWAVTGGGGLRIVAAGLACLVFAVSDEWHQSWVPGRVAALADLAADAGGIALGLTLHESLRPLLRAWKGGENR